MRTKPSFGSSGGNEIMPWRILTICAVIAIGFAALDGGPSAIVFVCQEQNGKTVYTDSPSDVETCTALQQQTRVGILSQAGSPVTNATVAPQSADPAAMMHPGPQYMPMPEAPGAVSSNVPAEPAQPVCAPVVNPLNPFSTLCRTQPQAEAIKDR
jgi:hypothetical protein